MAKISNSVVVIYDDRVEKFCDDPQPLAIKYTEMYQISEKFAFSSPRVIEVKADRIVLERLRNIIPVRDFYMRHRSKTIDLLVRQAGDVLARLHAAFRDDLATPWVPPGGFNRNVREYLGYALDYDALPRSVLHCDFGFSNIFVQTDGTPRIAVLDPCANFGSTFANWTSGPIHIDLGKMLSCLEGKIPARYQFRRPPRLRIEAMQRAFLNGYEEAAGLQVDTETAHAFAYADACAQAYRRFGAFGRLQSTLLYNRLRGNFPSERRLMGDR